MQKRPKLSVVIPCYNEEACLEMLHGRVSGAARAAVGDDYEIVLINDGSRDRSWDVMQRLSASDPRLVAINLSRNHGHQLALTAGLDLCAGEEILIIDADLLVQSILEGETVSAHMDLKPRLYPRLISSSMEMANDTGQAKPVLDYLNRFYREDLEMRIQILQGLIEPLLLLATSAILLFLILALMLPLYGRIQEAA